MSDNAAVVFPEPKTVQLEERPVEAPGEGELLVETSRTVLSTGTELTVLSGEYPDSSHWDEYGEYPFTPGYCNVGEVIEAGEGVEIEPGTTVASRTPHQRYVTADAADCTPVPASIPDEEASFFGLASIVMNGLRRGDVAWGETAAVYGLGLLGQLTARLCLFAGARAVVGFELAAGRRELAPTGHRRFVTADPTEVDPVAAVEDASDGHLADVVFEVTGNPDAIPAEFDVLRHQGRFVVLSSPRGPTTLDLHDHCNYPGYELIGAHEFTSPPAATLQTPWSRQAHYELFFDLVEAGDLDVADLITHRVPYAEAPELYLELLADRSDAMGVVLEW